MFASQKLMGPPKITPEVAYQGRTIDTSSSSTYTFTSQPFGAADINRRAIVVIHTSINASGSSTVQDSVTIGGITATKLASAVNLTTDTLEVGIWGVDLPTGTTATVVVNKVGADNHDHCSCSTYRVISSDLAVSDSGTHVSTATCTVDVNVATDGVVIAGYIATTATTATTWTGNSGLTLDYDVNNSDGDAEREAGSSGGSLVADTTFTVAAANSGAANALAVVAWN
jgi:hypothetical protein